MSILYVFVQRFINRHSLLDFDCEHTHVYTRTRMEIPGLCYFYSFVGRIFPDVGVGLQ